MKSLSKLVIPALAGLLLVNTANAWEATTTHAGLTEQSAYASDLHGLLAKQFGQEKGIYTGLTIPQADAPELFGILAKLNPTHGYTPDARGQMSALSWLVAGAVIADMPISHAANHFLDPENSKGLTEGKRALKHSLYVSLVSVGSPGRLSAGGQAANTWWSSAKNPMSYVGFAGQFRKAVTSPSATGRARHLAGSLLAAGSMLHILQDMGSPSHVRNDLAAHQEQVSASNDDLGSRFERIASLAFGRLGISRSTAAPALTSLSDHFSNPAGTGLADVTARGYFSSNTLPRSFSVRRDAGSSKFRGMISSHLRRPYPEAPANLDLVAARNPQGATWSNEDGVCLTRYKHKQATLSWWIDDDCALEQLEAVFPTIAGYGASFLERLYPSDISMTERSGSVVVTGDVSRYGAGSLLFFSESADGTRTQFHAGVRQGDSSELYLAPTPPAGTIKVAVLFDGTDNVGKPLLATTVLLWTASN